MFEIGIRAQEALGVCGAGERRGKRLVEEIRTEAEQALSLLERGLRDYAKKRR